MWESVDNSNEYILLFLIKYENLIKVCHKYTPEKFIERRAPPIFIAGPLRYFGYSGATFHFFFKSEFPKSAMHLKFYIFTKSQYF